MNDAWRLLPSADVLYACDAEWWRVNEGCRFFDGERWSSHGDATRDDKRPAAEEFDLNLVRGRDGLGFCEEEGIIHYAENSGFQAVNLALHFLGWRGVVALVGFNMMPVGGKSHFFGEHRHPLRRTSRGYGIWLRMFEAASRMLPDGVRIVNCTEPSALTCFPRAPLSAVLPKAKAS